MDYNIPKLLQNLQKNNMEGYFINEKAELINLLNQLILDGTSIGCGDSRTLEQMDVLAYLRNRNVVFFDKFSPALSREEKHELYIQNFGADTFITGSNAITMDGEIFNIDGNGSRVAPILYGPKQVIIVVGVNKISSNVKTAIERTRQIAAPLDAKRLGKSTPCVTLKRCIDCKHKERICNDFVLITGQFIKNRIKVIIINQSLGY